MHFLIISILLPILFMIPERIVASNDEENNFLEESLTPYIYQHGSKLNHRSIRDCHHEKFGSVPHLLYLAHQSENVTTPFVKVKRFVKEIKSSPSRIIRGHYVIISNPLETLSVLEPHQPGGCALNIRQTVAESSKNKCLVAVNAGYFNTKQGNCLGNVISDGHRAHDSEGVQNAHFGLTEDGNIFTGYVSEEFYLSGNLKQLVGGVIWIIRNGTGYVDGSKSLECEDTEETGPMESFINVLSARTAVGHDKDGKVILVHVDGKSYIDGANLYDMEILLKEFGLVNAINLDGGGSSTLVINGTTANYPYDDCTDESFSCDRKVSTILCVRSPYCDPVDCNNHGSCSMGKCICDENWLPPHCDKLFCSVTNCSNNGICANDGCLCQSGYFGKECNQTCNEGWYGSMCTKQCKCFNSESCDPLSGKCICKIGFTGDMCQQPCPEGFFGVNCQFKCQCNNSCCDPVNGACNTPFNASIYNYAKCVAESIIKTQNLVKDNPNERWKWYLTMIVLGVITSICIASCLIISCSSCSCYFHNNQVLCFKKAKKTHKRQKLQIPSGILFDSSSDDETVPMKDLYKR